MNIKLDHIVHFIDRHPLEAVEKFAMNGYKAVMGGSHEKWGSYNSLLYSASSYIEFLAVEHGMIAEGSENPLINQLVIDLKHRGEGLGQICFRTNHLSEVESYLKGNGFQTYPVFQGSRTRADGVTIRWKMLFVQSNEKLPDPFFIEWEQSDDERYAELKAKGMIDERLETKKAAAIYFTVKNFAAASRWEKLLDGKIIGRDDKEVSLMAGGVNLIFHSSFPEGEKPLDRPYKLQFSEPLQKSIELFGATYC